MSPQGGGAKVVHEVEIDWRDIQGEMWKGLRDNYEPVRAGVVREGMAKTMSNLKTMAER